MENNIWTRFPKSELGNPHEDYGPIYPVTAETTTLASRFGGGVGF